MGFLYLKSDQVKKDVFKAFDLLEKASFHGNIKATSSLAILYLKGKDKIDKDLEKSGFYFHKAHLLKQTESSKEKLLNFFTNYKVEWKTEYHPFWNGSQGLNNQITVLILISKNRIHSRSQIVKQLFVRGICLNVVKYLCHFNQKLIVFLNK